MHYWILVLILLGVIIAQHIWHGISQQMLVNKIMSNTFREYQESKAIKPIPPTTTIRLPEEKGPDEDLRSMNFL